MVRCSIQRPHAGRGSSACDTLEHADLLGGAMLIELPKPMQEHSSGPAVQVGDAGRCSDGVVEAQEHEANGGRHSQSIHNARLGVLAHCGENGHRFHWVKAHTYAPYTAETVDRPSVLLGECQAHGQDQAFWALV